MAPDTVIRSRANPLLKRAASALAGRERGVIVLEGDRLVDDALRMGLPLEVALVSDARPERARELADLVPVRVVDAELLQKVSALEHSPGVLALGPEPLSPPLERWPLGPRTLLLVAAGIADPGNLGALARSAEALGAQGLVVAGGASPFGPKALRGSMGSLLRLPVARAADAEALAAQLAARGVRQVRSEPRGGADPERFDWRGPLALWVSGETGTELAGLAAAQDFERVTLPMAGRVESLNVTVATALLLWSAGRVRTDGGDG
jgi:TrmH family RNA methyltransferase